MNRLQFVLRNSLRFYSIFAEHGGISKSAYYLQKPCELLTGRTFVSSCYPVHQKTAPTDLKAKKPKDVKKITLIAQNQSVSVTTLEEAQKLAKRRDLRLIQSEELDSKTGRHVYKLVTAAEILAQDLDEMKIIDKTGDKDKSSQNKSEKSLTIGARITEHDLSSRLKNIGKWLAKRHEVRILIQCNPDDVNGERIVKAIEMSIKEPEVIGKIVQKRNKGSGIKFNILPVNIAPTETSSATQS